MTTARRRLSAVAALFGEGFEGGRPRTAFFWITGTLLVLFPFSLFFVAGDVLPPRFSWTSTLFLALLAATTVLSEGRGRPHRIVILEMTLIGALLFFVEYIGVTTGFPFGHYRYSDILAPTLLGVPLAIAGAWYIAVMTSWRIAQWLVPGKPLFIVLTAGVLTLAFDLALEPMAAFVKGYWSWERGVVPLSNYVSWYVLSALTVAVRSRVSVPAALPGRGIVTTALVLYGMQWVLFALTGILHGFTGEILTSAGVLAGLGVLGWRKP